MISIHPFAETSREKRRKFIIAYLAEHGLVTSVTELRHLIWNHEESLGLKMRMDRKSLGRILDDLIRAKEIVIHTVSSVQGDVSVKQYCLFVVRLCSGCDKFRCWSQLSQEIYSILQNARNICHIYIYTSDNES